MFHQPDLLIQAKRIGWQQFCEQDLVFDYDAAPELAPAHLCIAEIPAMLYDLPERERGNAILLKIVDSTPAQDAEPPVEPALEHYTSCVNIMFTRLFKDSIPDTEAIAKPPEFMVDVLDARGL
jgi:hypothetical protein